MADEGINRQLTQDERDQLEALGITDTQVLAYEHGNFALEMSTAADALNPDQIAMIDRLVQQMRCHPVPQTALPEVVAA